MAELRHRIGVVNPQVEQKEQISVDDLQSLIELGCVKEEVVIGNLTFRMRSLNATERMELAKLIGDNPNADTLFYFNMKLLALSIESVNGKKLEELHSKYGSADVLSLKEEIISNMQAPVIAKLLSAYNKIAERCDSQFDVELIKK